MKINNDQIDVLVAKAFIGALRKQRGPMVAVKAQELFSLRLSERDVIEALQRLIHRKALGAVERCWGNFLVEKDKKHRFEKTSDEGAVFDGDVEVFQTKINQKKLRKEFDVCTTVPNISFTTSGVGFVDGKEFRFKPRSPKYRLFKFLFANLNNTVSQRDVLVHLGFYEDGEKILETERSRNTYEINEATKEIRSRTGLSTSHLILNGGTLTLVGNKVS